jgi:hypothetical protein
MFERVYINYDYFVLFFSKHNYDDVCAMIIFMFRIFEINQKCINLNAHFNSVFLNSYNEKKKQLKLNRKIINVYVLRLIKI